MQTQQVHLNEIFINDSNPRKISEERFEKLIDSILSFPKMLEIRPIVVGRDMIILGGNMRYKALIAIAEMQDELLTERISLLPIESKRSQEFWSKWKSNPLIHIVKADDLSEIEKKEFIIKDNVDLGVWDWDVLDQNYDFDQLENWGISLIKGSKDMDLSEFWGEGEVKHKEKGTVIEVVLPKDLNDKADEVKTAIEAALIDYNGIKVK